MGWRQSLASMRHYCPVLRKQGRCSTIQHWVSQQKRRPIVLGVRFRPAEQKFGTGLCSDDEIIRTMMDSYPAAVATGLPNRYYSNREDFLAEREKIFAPMWTCIGFASNAPNSGDVFPIEFMELPLLLVRGSDQVLRVF
ncbi:hypothetical protein N9444_09120, partial [Gammaproteobacteria bacterium]|nr:hypothetical protein [Gammaproteobacteria bacterium]